MSAQGKKRKYFVRKSGFSRHLLHLKINLHLSWSFMKLLKNSRRENSSSYNWTLSFGFISFDLVIPLNSGFYNIYNLNYVWLFVDSRNLFIELSERFERTIFNWTYEGNTASLCFSKVNKKSKHLAMSFKRLLLQ